MDLPEVCQQIALRGIRVIIAGLDMDYLGRPFGPIPNLLAIAEYITKVHAICPHCGNLATHSYRLTDETDTVVLGEKTNMSPAVVPAIIWAISLIFNDKVLKSMYTLSSASSPYYFLILHLQTHLNI